MTAQSPERFVRILPGDAQLGERASTVIRRADDVSFSAASAWEISIKAALGELELPDDFDLSEELDRGAFTALPLTVEHAVAMRALPPIHPSRSVRSNADRAGARRRADDRHGGRHHRALRGSGDRRASLRREQRTPSPPKRTEWFPGLSHSFPPVPFQSAVQGTSPHNVGVPAVNYPGRRFFASLTSTVYSGSTS